MMMLLKLEQEMIKKLVLLYDNTVRHIYELRSYFLEFSRLAN